MNFRGTARGRRRVETTLEMTPLIDVIFLLLIFFVMTTNPATSSADRLDLDLPDAESGEAALADDFRVVVQIFADGQVMIQEGEDGEAEVAEDLEAALGAIYGRRPDAPVWIRGDVEASHGAVIELLDIARTVGFTRVHMAVKPGS